jgi:hypothetical protein
MNVQIRDLRAACGWSDGRTKGRSTDYRGRLFLAAWALLGLVGLGCGAEDPEGLDGLGESAQELSACVTIQRGTLGTVQDASVVTDPTDPTRANQNLGSLPILTSGTIVLQTRESLLQFDLSPIPPGATILSATLGLTKLGNVGPTPVTVHAIGGTGWSEGTVNYNNFGGHSGPALATVGQIGLPPGSTWSVDLTSTVAAWYAGSAANHGVVLSIAPGRVAFSSSDDPSVSARPALTVCYDVPTCNDGVQNQGESGVDCGGPCSACATCSDGLQNQGETGVDCGGPCAACATCSDGILNQGETGVDCGGPCSACAAGSACTAVLAATPGATSGVYLVDLDGPGPLAAFPEYCDMDTAGGGFTLVAVFSNKDASNWQSPGGWSQSTPFGTHADIGQGDYKSPAFGRLASNDLLISQKSRDATSPLDGGAGFWRHTANAFAGTGNLMNLYNSLAWPTSVCFGGLWSCAAHRAPLTSSGVNGTVGTGDAWGFAMKTFDPDDDGLGAVVSPYYADDFMGGLRKCNFGGGQQSGAPDVGDTFGSIGGAFCSQASGGTTQFLLWER